MTTHVMLNLGCGSRYRETWVNVNFSATGDGVIAANLNDGIPFPDESFDVVYHSHLLEHFTKSAAVDFLKECYRVLKSGGVIRVVVPDLEAIARNYLLALENAKQGKKGWGNHYDWMMLEMYDQVVRNYPGGEMVRYLSQPNLANEDYVIGRCGAEIINIIEDARKSRPSLSNLGQTETAAHTSKFSAVLVATSFRRTFKILNKEAWKNLILQKLLGTEYEALETARFRLKGEVHQWMYDSYSLGRLLKHCNFFSIKEQTAVGSYIPNWASHNLDTESDGSVYKPDSLFMEGVKP